jgi:hypothetical protein
MVMPREQIELTFKLIHHFFISGNREDITPGHNSQLWKKTFYVFKFGVIHSKQFGGVQSSDFDLSF